MIFLKKLKHKVYPIDKRNSSTKSAEKREREKNEKRESPNQNGPW